MSVCCKLQQYSTTAERLLLQVHSSAALLLALLGPLLPTHYSGTDLTQQEPAEQRPETLLSQQSCPTLSPQSPQRPQEL